MTGGGMTGLSKYAVCMSIGTEIVAQDFDWIEFYDAEDGEHAEEQALNANPTAAIVCVAMVPS